MRSHGSPYGYHIIGSVYLVHTAKKEQHRRDGCTADGRARACPPRKRGMEFEEPGPTCCRALSLSLTCASCALSQYVRRDIRPLSPHISANVFSTKPEIEPNMWSLKFLPLPTSWRARARRPTVKPSLPRCPFLSA